MNSSDLAIEQYLALRPSNFSILVRFEICQYLDPVNDICILALHIDLRSDRANDPTLHLSFYGVHGLRLALPTLSQIRLSPIEIRSIRERQWERLNYEVKVTEDTSLAFLCDRFEFRLERQV